MSYNLPRATNRDLLFHPSNKSAESVFECPVLTAFLQDFGGLGVSGTAVTAVRASTAGNHSRQTPQKRSARPDTAAQHTADEVPVGSGLIDQGFDDTALENMCRLQYARWNNMEEYIATVGNQPDMWPSGLIKVRAVLSQTFVACTALQQQREENALHIVELHWRIYCNLRNFCNTNPGGLIEVVPYKSYALCGKTGAQEWHCCRRTRQG